MVFKRNHGVLNSTATLTRRAIVNASWMHEYYRFWIFKTVLQAHQLHLSYMICNN